MVTSSYPRFPGDAIGTFMEPIAQGVAARGYAVHMVAPWHALWNRPVQEAGVRFHLFRRAKHVMGASIGAYALLDAYWVFLLLGPLTR